MSDGTPSLMQCALTGDTGGVDAALQRGDAVNEMEDGRTALHQTAAEGQLDVVKLLLYWHADTNRKSRRDDDNGGTALHLAVEGGHAGVVEELLEAGADCETLDGRGRTAAHRAASRGQKNSLEVLKKYGSNMEARDSGKATPLHFAAYHGSLGVVVWLVEEAEVNLQFKDRNGRTPKDVAKRHNNNEIHRFLKEGGGTKKTNMFGGPKARKSMRSSSRQRGSRDGSLQRVGKENNLSREGRESNTLPRVGRDGSRHRATEDDSRFRNESPAPSSEPESITTSLRQIDKADNEQQPVVQSTTETTALVSTSLNQAPREVRASEPSLSPPETPPQAAVQLRPHDSRRRTGSTRSSRGRSLKNQVEDLADIRVQLVEEIEFKNEEIAKLKDHLSHVERGKSQTEEQVNELRYHIERQQQQLADVTEVEKQVQALSQQKEDYQANLSEALMREAELNDQDSINKQTINKLVERDSINQQKMEMLKRESERLSIELKASEERIAHSQEALRIAAVDAADASTVASLKDEVDHLTFMLNETGQRAITNQEKLERKISDLKEKDESSRITIAMLTEKVRSSENKFQHAQEELERQISELMEQDESSKITIAMLMDKLRSSEEQATSVEDQEVRLQDIMDQDTDNKLTIASLNAKIQELTRSLNDRDHTTLTYHKQQHAKIEELTEKDDRNRKNSAILRAEMEKLSLNLKESQDSIGWYQGQLQQKQREKEQQEQQEATSQQAITELNGRVENLTQRLEEAQQKAPLSQYERGGSMVALQKREVANKQTIKALENQIQALSHKMSESENASLSVQRQQLETINSLKQQLDAERRTGSAGPLQEANIQELMEQDISNKLIIETLNKKIDHLSGELKKNFTNFSAWQAQQQDKDKEHEQRETESQKTIAALREDIVRLQQDGATSQSAGVAAKGHGASYTPQYHQYSPSLQPKIYTAKPYSRSQH